jgi:hypothetical protein
MGDFYSFCFSQIFHLSDNFSRISPKSVVVGDHTVAVGVLANASTVVSISAMAVLLLLTFLLLLAFLR